LHDLATGLEAITLVICADQFLFAMGQLALEQFPLMSLLAQDRTPGYSYRMGREVQIVDRLEGLRQDAM
jgi:hypothetical protein